MDPRRLGRCWAAWPLALLHDPMAQQHALYEKTLLQIMRGSCFAAPFLVFYVAWNLPFPFVTGRNFLFRVLVEIAFTCWIGLAALRKSYRPTPGNPLLWAVGAFLLTVGLADAIGLNPYRGFWGNHERMEGYLSLLHFGAFFLVLASAFDEKDWRIIWNLFLVAGVTVAFHTLLAWFGLIPHISGSMSRPGSLLGNPNPLAVYLLLTGGIGLLLCFGAGSQRLRYLYGVAALLQFVTILFPASRAVVLGLLCGVLLFLLLYAVFGEHQPDRQRAIRRWAAVSAVVLISIPIVYLGALKRDIVSSLQENHVVQTNPLLSRLGLSADADPSLLARLRVWAILWKGFRERPVSGWGQESVALLVGRSDDQELFNLADLWYDRAHNVLLEWLTAAGVLGLLSYLSLFGCAFFLLWRSYSQKTLRALKAITLCALLVSYLVQNLFQFDTLMSYVIFFAILAFLAGMKSQTGLDPEKTHRTSPVHDRPAPGRSYAVLLGASLILGYGSFVTNVRPYLQAMALGETVKLFKIGNLDLVIAHFDHALSYQTFGDSEVRNRIFLLAERLYCADRVPPAVKGRILQYAIQEFEREREVNPVDVRPQLVLATLREYQHGLPCQSSLVPSG